MPGSPPPDFKTSDFNGAGYKPNVSTSMTQVSARVGLGGSEGLAREWEDLPAATASLGPGLLLERFRLEIQPGPL